jgi:hypothetical protein
MTNTATRITLLILTLCVGASGARAQRKRPTENARLREATFREIGYADAPKDFKYVSRGADLNGDGRAEVFVWVPSTNFGGTSGYPLLLFARGRGRYRLLWKYEQVWTPLVVLNTSRFGWRDLAVQMGGGGVKMHYVVFRHDGRAYPSEPAHISERRVRGRMLVGQGWRASVMGPLPVEP